MIRFACALFLSTATLASAQDGGDILDANILTGWQRADGKHVAALKITLNDGWKTYWRAPGDAGIPPHFNWKKSRNLAGVAISWPTPKRIPQGGVMTLGYDTALTLPLTLTPAKAGTPIKLAGEVTIGVCKDVCVPLTLNLSQALPVGQTKPDPRIVAALADRPYTAREAKVGRVACEITPTSDGLKLSAEVDVPNTGGRELAVIETGNPQIWVAQSKTKRNGGRLYATTELYHVEGRSFALNRSDLRITVLGRSHAVDIQGCPAG